MDDQCLVAMEKWMFNAMAEQIHIFLKYTQRGKQRKETQRIIFDPILHSQGYALQAVATYEERTGRVNRPFSLSLGFC